MAETNLKPMTWDELRRLPEYARVEYILALRQTFGCGVGQMAEMFGLKKKDFVRETELLGMDLSGARPVRDPEKLAAWAAFCGKSEPEPAPEPQTPTTIVIATEPEPEPEPKSRVTVKSLSLAYTGTLERALTELEVYADVLAGQTVTVTVELEVR